MNIDKRPIINRDYLRVRGDVAGKKYVISTLGGWGEMFSALWAAQTLEHEGANVLFVVRTWFDDSFLHMADGVTMITGCWDKERSIQSAIGIQFWNDADYHIQLDEYNRVKVDGSVYQCKLYAAGGNPSKYPDKSIRPKVILPQRIAINIPTLPRDFIAVHYRTEYIGKSLHRDIVRRIVDACPLPCVMLGPYENPDWFGGFGPNAIACPTHKFAEACSILSNARAAICIDSSISHAGHAFNVPMVVVYNAATPPRSQLARHAASSKFVQAHKCVGDDWVREVPVEEIITNLNHILNHDRNTVSTF